MAGRKRKIAMAGSGTGEQSGSLNESKYKTLLKSDVSDSKLRKPIENENAQSVEAEQSRYFIKNMQHRLGQEFFNQPCISLATAFLGKVKLS